MASFCLQSGFPEPAEKLFLQYLSRTDGGNNAVYYALADIYGLWKQQGACKDSDKRILSFDPGNPAVQNALMYLDNPRPIMPSGNKPEVTNTEAVSLYNQGNEFFRNGLADKALNAYNEAIHLNPAYTKALNNRGILKASSFHQFREAIDDFNEVIRLDPANADAYLGRGSCLFQLRERDSACKDWEKADKLGTQEPAYYWNSIAVNKEIISTFASHLSGHSMSDFIHHECGIALVRLLQPLEYYLAKYGTAFYGLNKLHLLMQKQHNRGQDGAGVAVIKFDLEPGNRFIHRLRSNADSPIQEIFNKIGKKLGDIEERYPQNLLDVHWLKHNVDFMGELYLGHLRYGTFGKNSTLHLHPLVRENNWLTKNLVIAGNFNLTNVDELFNKLIDLGQYPIETSDTVTILEKIGHFLDEENEDLYRKFKEQGFKKSEITFQIAKQLNVQKILRASAKYWDGGYVIAGLFGHGDAFIMRDPSGIRPAFYFQNDEIVVVTSERPVIQTALNVPFEDIKELSPGSALIIKKDGRVGEKEFRKPLEKTACSFERIYFSRGTDKDIYRERKKLGKFLAPGILKAIDYDFENTVFSYIPNTAVDAYYGLVEEVSSYCNKIKAERIVEAGKNPDRAKIEEILKLQPRTEKVAVKDVKLRTFITRGFPTRHDLAAHIYDITYGSIRPGLDNLVVLDDSIVRGTTP